MSKNRLSIAALVLVGSFAATSTARAAAIGFTLTEVDSLTLTSNLAGLVIIPIGTDLWDLDFGPTAISQFAGDGIQNGWAWAEPGNPLIVNYLSQFDGALFSFQSDMTIADLPKGLLCGVMLPPFQLGVSCLIGTDVAGNSYSVAVNDNGDEAAAVPEPASMLLLGTGIAGMRLRRWRNRRRGAWQPVVQVHRRIENGEAPRKAATPNPVSTIPGSVHPSAPKETDILQQPNARGTQGFTEGTQGWWLQESARTAAGSGDPQLAV